MITEDRVMTILTQSNPVPEIDKVELTQVGATKYLVTLRQSGSKMTKTVSRPTAIEPKPKRPAWGIAGAVVVLIAGLAVTVTQWAGTDTAGHAIGQMAGEWKFTAIADARIEILESGTYTSTRGLEIVDSGTVSVDGEQIRFVTQAGSDCAPGNTGVYSVTSFGPDAYRLNVVSDNCESRAADLDGSQFLRPAR